MTQAAHRWLQQLLGTWEMTGDGWKDCQWRAYPVGDLWIRAEWEGHIENGESFINHMVLGLDAETNQAVGNFVTSMDHNHWVYRGELDEAANTLHLYADGPKHDGTEGTATYRDSVILTSPDSYTFEAHVLQPDGTWQKFMHAEARRISL